MRGFRVHCHDQAAGLTVCVGYCGTERFAHSDCLSTDPLDSDRDRWPDRGYTHPQCDRPASDRNANPDNRSEHADQYPGAVFDH